MKFLWFFLAGTLGGVLAGMGMGGGTLTIPLLVLALGVGQLTAQFVNLIAFLSSGSAALALHVKNGLVDADNLSWLFVPALISAVIASVFALDLDDTLLRKLFGGFLIIVAAVSLSVKIFKKG